MTRVEFWSAVMGLLVAIVVMFNQMNGRIDDLNGRIDAMQVENQRQHDATQTEINQLRTEMNRRFDTMQAENQRQHDTIAGSAARLRGTHYAARRESRNWTWNRRVSMRPRSKIPLA